MGPTITCSHPSLKLGPPHIPGPSIPIIILVFPYVVRPHTRQRLFPYLGHFLTLFHLFLYLYNIRGLLTKKEHEHTNVLPILEYLTLVLGEADLEVSNLWLYTSLAVGWVQPVCPSDFSNRLDILLSTKRCVSLLLSIPSALGMKEPLSIGATLSTLSLLTRNTFRTSTRAATVQGVSVSAVARISMPALARPCYAMFVRMIRSHSQSNRLYLLLQTRLRCILHRTIGQCADVYQTATATHTLLIAGWLMSSFLSTCFRWRWLFYGQASMAPAWTASSFFLEGYSSSMSTCSCGCYEGGSLLRM